MKKNGSSICSLFHWIFILGIMFTLSDSAQAGEAQKFPAKPITMIVPYNAGSGLDIEVRGFQPYFQKQLGVQLIITNIPGADGRLGISKAFKAPNDGYSLISPGWPAPVVGELMYKPAYKSLEFTYIGAWTESNYLIVAHADTWKTFDEFVKTGKERTLNCGITGLSSVVRVLGEALSQAAGIKFNWIPFEGGGPSVTALAGKHVDLVMTSTSSALPLARAGRIRPLLIFGNKRDISFPQVPTGKELGYPISLPNTRSILGPPGMSLARVKAIESAMIKAANEPDYQAWLKAKGMEVVIRTHEQLRKEAEADYAMIQKYFSQMDLKAN